MFQFFFLLQLISTLDIYQLSLYKKLQLRLIFFFLFKLKLEFIFDISLTIHVYSKVWLGLTLDVFEHHFVCGKDS